VTDHDMSGMTGLELMHILRNDPRFEKIPVIVLSATDVRQAVESAGRIFVDKMNPSRLRRALEDAATVARTNILLRD
jgi:CheY-like chemotaxis protein